MNILITGGSRGIGAEAVRRFTAQGHRVRFLYASSREKAEAIARETGAEAVQCDVADGAAVQRAVAGFDADALINNAALAHYGLINQIDEETWNRLFAVNVNGIYHCVNAVLPGMLHKQRGVIVNVASMWGQVGASCEVCYSATKGAVIALTKALAKELAPSGIRVNAVSPGVVETDMVANVDRESMEAIREETPLGRHGKPADIVKAMAYLLEADFVTGQVLPVNGGLVI